MMCIVTWIIGLVSAYLFILLANHLHIGWMYREVFKAKEHCELELRKLRIDIEIARQNAHNKATKC